MKAAETVEVSRDVCTVTRCGWSPQELYSVIANTNPLLPAHPPAPLFGSVVDRITPSLAFGMDFENLQRVLDPLKEPSAADHTRILGPATTRLMSTDLGRTAAATVDLSTKVARLLDPLNLFADVHGGSAGTERRAIYRITTDVSGGCRYTVERSQLHVFQLLLAVNHTFPELAIPAVARWEHVQSFHLEALLELISEHPVEFASFFPALFFLFELNARSFNNFSASLPDAIRVSKEADEAVFAAKQKSLMSWFGSQSQSASLATLQPAEVSAFLRRNESKFPFSFIAEHERSAEMLDVSQSVVEAARLLESSIRTEIESFAEFANALASDDGWLLPLPKCIRDGPANQEAALDSMRQSVATFCQAVQTQQQVVAFPMISMMCTSAEAYAARVESAFALGQRLCEAQYWIATRAEIMAKKSPLEVRDMKVVLERRRGAFEAMAGAYTTERQGAKRKADEALKRSCVYLSSSLYHLCDPLAPRHHQGLLVGLNYSAEEQGRSCLDSPTRAHPIEIALHVAESLFADPTAESLLPREATELHDGSFVLVANSAQHSSS